MAKKEGLRDRPTPPVLLRNYRYISCPTLLGKPAMPLAEYLEGPNSAQSANGASTRVPENSAAKMRKKVSLQFGALVALGLALAGWYVGYRVFKARAGAPPVPAIVVHTQVPI